MDCSQYIFVLADVFDYNVLPKLCLEDLASLARTCKTCYDIIEVYLNRETSEREEVKKEGFRDEKWKLGKSITSYEVLKKHPDKKHGKYLYNTDETRFKDDLEFNFFFGELHGKFKSWDGFSRIEGTYCRGILHGKFTTTGGRWGDVSIYYKNGEPYIGKKYACFNVDSDRQILTKFGQIAKITFYKNNAVRGYSYYNTDALSGHTILHGRAEKFHEGGQTKVEKNFQNGKLNGKYVKFDKSGNTLISIRLLDGQMFFPGIKYKLPPTN